MHDKKQVVHGVFHHECGSNMTKWRTVRTPLEQGETLPGIKERLCQPTQLSNVDVSAQITCAFIGA